MPPVRACRGAAGASCEADTMQLGKLGVFLFLDSYTSAQTADMARQMEGWGYSALWYPEAVGRNTMVQAAWLLSQTQKLVVASGIANIYARDAQATVSARKALDEMSGGRYLLGLGVSHAPLVKGLRGQNYGKPLARMREYLEAMKRAIYQSPNASQEGEMVLAALGPKMLELSRDQSDGAHPYNVTPEHTRRAREILGAGKKLYVEQKVCLESDPVKARQAAKLALDFYLGLPNYRNNWVTLGFSEQEIDSASDRFLDAMVAWGSVEQIRQRIQEHFEAGADHVCIQPVTDVMGTLEALKP
jgi:probable F420-dependent oxidoreductase